MGNAVPSPSAREEREPLEMHGDENRRPELSDSSDSDAPALSSLSAPGRSAAPNDAAHIALDVDTDSDSSDMAPAEERRPETPAERALRERQAEDALRANNEQRGLNVYFGQVMAALTGNDSDEIFGFPQGEQAQDAAHPLTTLAQLSSQVSATTTVSSAVNLNRDTLRLNADSASLTFFVDCSAPAVAEFYFHFDENATAPSKPFHISQIAAGIGLSFSDAALKVDLSQWRNEELAHVEASGRHPLAVKLTPRDPINVGEVEQQWTFAEFAKNADGAFEVRTTKQTIRVNGLTYVVHDIFGINHADPASPIKEDCVICLTEVRDTVVIPCRHLCVCHQCAQVLRYQSNKCPICRGPARAMLRLEITPVDDKDDLSSAEEKGKVVVSSSSSTTAPSSALLDQGASLL